jgi:hypothetical protein
LCDLRPLVNLLPFMVGEAERGDVRKLNALRRAAIKMFRNTACTIELVSKLRRCRNEYLKVMLGRTVRNCDLSGLLGRLDYVTMPRRLVAFSLLRTVRLPSRCRPTYILSFPHTDHRPAHDR